MTTKWLTNCLMTSSVIVADSSPLISLARRVAERLQIRRIGTLGILQRAKKAGLMSEVKSYIERLLYQFVMKASLIFLPPLS